MLIPRWLLVGAGVLLGLLTGAMLHATMADDSRTRPVAQRDSSHPTSVVPRGESAARPVHVTIVVPETPASPDAPAADVPPAALDMYVAGVPTQAATPTHTLTSSSQPSFAYAPTPTPTQARNVPHVASTSAPAPTPTQARNLADVASASAPAPSPTQTRNVSNLASAYAPAPAPTQAPNLGDALSADAPAPAPTQTRHVADVASASVPAPTPTQTRNGGETSRTLTGSGPPEARAPNGVEGLSVIANGDRIVIANNGSIVSVGDNTVLKANTGNAGASGVIALDVVDSAVTSGSSGLSGPAGGSSRTTPGLSTGTPEGVAVAAARSSAPEGSAPDTRAVAIAGYENKPLEVAGNDNLLTHDDSNLFHHRAGHLNGNTGETDTSGLNVVDATRSLVRSGNSRASQDPPPRNQTGVGSSPVGVGSPPAPGTARASVADVNSTATATGADSLVIGGHGVIDAGVRAHGDRNVATSDDGNAAVGGVGDANAQVGDSDTSGAVAMDVTDTEITTGSSLPPPSEPVGTQQPYPSHGHTTSQAPTSP